MPQVYQPAKPVYRKDPDPRYEERHKRTLEAHARINFSYNPDSYLDRRRIGIEALNINLQRQFDDCVTERLVAVQRVLLPEPNMFEFKDGTLDSNHKVKSAIVYKVTVTIEDPNARKAGYHKIMDIEEMGCGSVTFTCGRYQRPIAEPTAFDRQGNITNARIKEYHNTYYIEDKPETLKAIFKKYGERPARRLTCHIANLQGSPYNGSFSTINDREFETGDISQIIGGNNMGLTASAFTEWEVKREKLIEGGTATRNQLDKLSDKDIVNLIHSKEKTEKKQ